MNKILIASLIASGLLLLDSPEASAHNEARNHHRSSDHNYSRSYDRDYYYSKRGHSRHNYASKYARSYKMPRWLKRDRSFRRWYKYTEYRADRRVSWNRLFDIYRYEYRYHRNRYR